MIRTPAAIGSIQMGIVGMIIIPRRIDFIATPSVRIIIVIIIIGIICTAVTISITIITIHISSIAIVIAVRIRIRSIRFLHRHTSTHRLIHHRRFFLPNHILLLLPFLLLSFLLLLALSLFLLDIIQRVSIALLCADFPLSIDVPILRQTLQ